jgi:glycosyltransferase involved in cell wall biosynthesis
MQPKISIITVVKNAVDAIASCIECILAQRYPNTEIIVIDGGSTDGTQDILARYALHISYLESGLDTGIANAFNRGIAKATGDIVAILNADDRWTSDTLNRVIDAYYKNPSADIFYGSVIYVDAESGRSYRKDPRLDRMSFRMNLFHPAVFVARKTYQAIGVFDESYRVAMDCEWLHRALARECKFVRVDGVLAFMSLGGASDRSFIRALQEYRSSVVSHKLTSSLMAAIYFYVLVVLKTLLRMPLLRSILWLKNKATKINNR